MKAEEYIEFNWRSVKNYKNCLTYQLAMSAIEMARVEERRRAAQLHMKYCGNYRCPSNKQSFGNNKCEGNCLIMEKFKEELNK